MKTEKMIKLLSILFIVSLSVNLFAQEGNKKENEQKKQQLRELTIKVIADKNHSDSGNEKMIWVVKGSDIEWDTTFSIGEDNEIDIDEFLKKRFPDLDSSIYTFKQMQIHTDGDSRKLKVMHNAHVDNILKYKLEKGEKCHDGLILLELEEMDSLLSDHSIQKTYIIKEKLAKNLKILDERLGNLKLHILKGFDDTQEHKIRVEVLSNIKENLGDMEYVYHYAEDHDEEIIDLHESKEFSIGFVIDDELNEDDLKNIKNAGLKISNDKLDIRNVYLYSADDGFLNLKFKLKSEGKTIIKIITADGQEIFTDKVRYFPGTYDKQTKLSMEDEGIYYIYIEQNNNTFACRMKLD